MDDLAPVCITVYTRLEHIKLTVAALAKNNLAKESTVIFLSDAPRDGDEQAVRNMRSFLSSVQSSGCFKEVRVVKRTTNNRMFNGRDGMREALDEFGKFIYLEEDVVVNQGFLKYMNDALNFYQQDENVISISGYRPPFSIPGDLPNDNFFLKRFNGWGFATWAHKFDPFGFEISEKYAWKVLRSYRLRRQFKSRGPDMVGMLKSELSGKIDALDVKIMFSNFVYGTYCSYPKVSFVQNIGFDGTGIHCGKTDKFLNNTLNQEIKDFNFSTLVEEDSRILRENYKFRSVSIGERFISRLSRIYESLVKS